jgi:hypothetical protein
MSHFKRIWRGAMLAGVLMLGASPALAQHEVRPRLANNTRSVPEIDPVAAGAVVSVLVGGMLLIGARRRRREPRA